MKNLFCAILALFTVLGISGCMLNRSSIEKKYYMLNGIEYSDFKDANTDIKAPLNTATVNVSQFEAGNSMKQTGLVYRVSETRYETDFYNEFMASPSGMVTSNFERALLLNGINVIPGLADCSVYGKLNALYVDFRDKDAPKVVLDLSIVIRSNVKQKLIGTKHYYRQLELEEKSPESVVKGYNKCLSQILSEFVNDLEIFINQ